MDIGLAVDRYDEGVGMANVVFNLAKQLSEDHEVSVVTWEGLCSESFVELSEEAGVDVEKFSFSSGLRMKLNLRKYAKKIEGLDLDVVNAHGFNMANAAALSDVPTLKTNHAHALIPSELKKHPVRLPLWLIEEIPSVYLSDDIVSISEYARRQMKKIYRKESEVIYNGIDLDTYRPIETDFLDRRDISYDGAVFGTLCALRPHKNLDLAIDALADVEENYIYLVAGKGPEKDRLKEKAKKKDVNIRFLGFLDEEELPEFYSSLDLFLFPSLWEGFGVPVLESMACGTPAAVLDQKGPKELVVDGETGYTLPEETDVWTEKLERFTKSNEPMTEESRKRAEEFSWAEISDKYEKKLRELSD